MVDQNTESEVSKAYVGALRNVVNHGVRALFSALRVNKHGKEHTSAAPFCLLLSSFLAVASFTAVFEAFNERCIEAVLLRAFTIRLRLWRSTGHNQLPSLM